MPRGRTVTPLSQVVSCDLCGRSLLPGERVYDLWERDQQRTVCELCLDRAREIGWEEGEERPRPPAEGREGGARRLRLRLGGLRRARERSEDPLPAQPAGAPPAEELPTEERALPAAEAALALFNQSEGVARLKAVARSLGEPVITLFPLAGADGAFGLTAAWEICWYRYRIDLAAGSLEAELLAWGEDPEQLPAAELVGNCRLDPRRGVVLAGGVRGGREG